MDGSFQMMSVCFILVLSEERGRKKRLTSNMPLKKKTKQNTHTWQNLASKRELDWGRSFFPLTKKAKNEEMKFIVNPNTEVVSFILTAKKILEVS